MNSCKKGINDDTLSCFSHCTKVCPDSIVLFLLAESSNAQDKLEIEENSALTNVLWQGELTFPSALGTDGNLTNQLVTCTLTEGSSINPDLFGSCPLEQDPDPACTCYTHKLCNKCKLFYLDLQCPGGTCYVTQVIIYQTPGGGDDMCFRACGIILEPQYPGLITVPAQRKNCCVTDAMYMYTDPGTSDSWDSGEAAGAGSSGATPQSGTGKPVPERAFPPAVAGG